MDSPPFPSSQGTPGVIPNEFDPTRHYVCPCCTRLSSSSLVAPYGWSPTSDRGASHHATASRRSPYLFSSRLPPHSDLTVLVPPADVHPGPTRCVTGDLQCTTMICLGFFALLPWDDLHHLVVSSLDSTLTHMSVHLPSRKND